MFDSLVLSNAFLNVYADHYYRDKIDARQSIPPRDYTLETLIRAVVVPRLPEGKAFNYSYTSIRPGRTYDVWLYNRKDYDLIIVRAVHSEEYDETGTFYNFTKSALEAGFAEEKKVPKFFQKDFPVRCFLNKEEKRSIVLYGDAENYTVKREHHLLSALMAYLPWFFENGVDPDEMEVFRGLTEKTSDRFDAAIEKLGMRYSFREDGIRKMLGDFETASMLREADAARADIEDIMQRINSLQEQISASLSAKQEYEIKLRGLQKTIDGAQNGILVDYFTAAKNIEILECCDGIIKFVVYGYLTYWNEECARAFIDNKRCYAYSYTDDKDGLEMLFRAVLIDQRVRIRMCACYEMTNNSIHAGNYVYDTNGTYAPNPHLYYHSCLGDFVPQITKSLIDGDLIGAVESAVVSCSSVNMSESLTVSPFIRDIFCGGKRVFEMPDGLILTPAEAIKVLKEESGNA